MRSERQVLSGDAVTLARELRELVPAPESVSDTVAEIIERVRASGDDALRYYTREFDTRGATPASLVVPDAELDTALERLDDDIRAGLELAIANVGRVAEAQLAVDRTVRFDAPPGVEGAVAGGHEVRVREVPLARAAVYVPAGRAPYPSTVVMGVVAARVAGVGEIAVCSPPGESGDVDPVLLAAWRLAGATVGYRMGGAQAIAALAYGTESVRPVDVIVGPGNLYVQEAKRQVFGQVSIDGFAGPSDLVVIADGDDDAVDPGALALDLLAQAEHGAGSIVVLLSGSDRLLDAVQARIDDAPDGAAIVRLIGVGDLHQAFVVAETFAPEHLQLMGAAAEAFAPDVRHAGCVLIGARSGTAFSDYVAGSTHVLPTNGAARFASGLSPSHFRRHFSEIRIGAGASALARAAAPIARAEGFEMHARSMEARADG
ncbi:MAG TPA: histidinol dehydrogenase [Solirubrobacteraceae bacterium]|nr:histidinol dehydrogenase [Solirubrobacteraceae bacterium]